MIHLPFIKPRRAAAGTIPQGFQATSTPGGTGGGRSMQNTHLRLRRIRFTSSSAFKFSRPPPPPCPVAHTAAAQADTGTLAALTPAVAGAMKPSELGRSHIPLKCRQHCSVGRRSRERPLALLQSCACILRVQRSRAASFRPGRILLPPCGRLASAVVMFRRDVDKDNSDTGSTG